MEEGHGDDYNLSFHNHILQSVHLDFNVGFVALFACGCWSINFHEDDLWQDGYCVRRELRRYFADPCGQYQRESTEVMTLQWTIEVDGLVTGTESHHLTADTVATLLGNRFDTVAIVITLEQDDVTELILTWRNSSETAPATAPSVPRVHSVAIEDNAAQAPHPHPNPHPPSLVDLIKTN